MPKIRWLSLEDAVSEAVARLAGDFTAKDIEGMLDPTPKRGAVYYLLRHAFKDTVKRTEHGTYRRRGSPPPTRPSKE